MVTLVGWLIFMLFPPFYYSRMRKRNNKETECFIQWASSTKVNYTTRVTTLQLKQPSCSNLSFGTNRLVLSTSYKLNCVSYFSNYKSACVSYFQVTPRSKLPFLLGSRLVFQYSYPRFQVQISYFFNHKLDCVSYFFNYIVVYFPQLHVINLCPHPSP